jgi:hypothetical protein
LKRLKKGLTKTIFSLMIMSLLTTSFGGAWATTAYAAEIEDQTVQSSDNKAVVGGLVALGLLAIVTGGKKGSNNPQHPRNV